jgi:hypothetical protein
MKYLRYKGEFVSQAGTIWRVELLQEADAAFNAVGALTFDAGTPVEIEYERKDKEEVICGSTATIKLISPGDRTYEDLYSIEAGYIRMDLYKDGALYWSGCLDPEFYEEPYEQEKGYTVALTFSDFGILERLKYDLTGICSLLDIITYALQQSGINYSSINTDYITTTFADGSAITGGALSIRSDNFIDEDGEASTLEEVVEGILQPLAAKIVQRFGVVYIYDLNGLYTKGAATEITWDGDSQTMGVDKVANNITVSFSPYSSSTLLDGEIEYGAGYGVQYSNITNQWAVISEDGKAVGRCLSYYPDYSEDNRADGTNWDYNLIDFNIFSPVTETEGKCTGLASIGGNMYFHILPMTGGVSECSGVAYAFRTGGHGALSTGWPRWATGNTSIPHPSTKEVLTSNRAFLPYIASADAAKYRIRVMEEICLDARYNPFSGSTEDNDEGNDNKVKVWSGYVFLPAAITLYDKDGKALYHYRNKSIAMGAAKCRSVGQTGEWVAGADPGGDCWLEYYSTDDQKEDAGIRDWSGNRHCIGRPDGEGGRTKANLYPSFKLIDDGEYLPYPPVAGYLEVQIRAGFYGYDYGNSCEWGSSNSHWDKKGIYDILRWCLYKAPVVDVVNYNLVFDDAELEDVEYQGYINESAKDEISIDTICGTASAVCPTAKGIFCRTDTGQQILQLSRAGRTEHPEQLLIGTLHSQYADRKTTLSGEAIIDGGLHYYTEQNQEGKRFMLMNDVQNLITDCTEAEYCEFRPDEYSGKEG